MNDELKAFCSDLRDRLGWLTNEIQRLAAENQRLRSENQALREEATLVRLYRDLESPASEEPVAPAHVPDEVMQLFMKLPDTFLFGEFFQVAEEEGLSSEVAKEHMLLLLRHRMLLQRGTRMQKNKGVPFSVGSGSQFYTRGL